MPQTQTFEDFLSGQSAENPISLFLTSLALSALLGHALGKLYERYGRSLSNRSSFASNFVLLTVTTMLVISVVKSSLALSLGMVGALSIVRFRAAIKEPEELTYLFLAIAIGVGLGAGQWRVTVATFLFVALLIVLRRRIRPGAAGQNLYLTVSSRTPDRIELDAIVQVLARNCAGVSMTRFDETKDSLEASFHVDVAGIEELERTRADLRGLGDDVSVSFLETRGLA